MVRKLLQRFLRKLEWSDSSCSRVDNSLIQMICLELCLRWTELHKREPGDLGGTCATVAARSFTTVEFWVNYVTENHIWVKTDSCLGTKSVVKGIYLSLWNAYANQCQCLYDLGQNKTLI